MERSQIVYSEWLRGGVMVHFVDERSVFFPSEFLFDHREEQERMPEPDPDGDRLIS